MFAVVAPSVVLAGLAVSLVFDRRTIYMDSSCPELPWWLRPSLFSWRRELLAMTLTRSSILRLCTATDEIRTA
jgi:hypothetical protein